MNILSQYRFLLLLSNAHPSKTNRTAQETHVVLKSYKKWNQLSPKGKTGETKKKKTAKKTSSTMNTEEKTKKVHRANCINQKSVSQFRINSPFKHRFLSDQWLKRLLFSWSNLKRKKRERPGVGDCLFSQVSCASLSVGFFQCCWQWGGASVMADDAHGSCRM